jgi:hypothetical protein
LFPNLLNAVLSWPHTLKLIDLISPSEFAKSRAIATLVRFFTDMIWSFG